MILPGTTVIIDDPTSIYNGYRGFVQRLSGDKAAVLFDEINGCPWEKLVTFPIKDIKEDTTGKQFYKMK
jgi:hypothetical protein